MTQLGSTAGLWMLLALAALIVITGLPVWALLIGVASAFAGAALLGGVFDAAILAALPTRIVGLLENDLLQALPLYVFIGVLLQHLTLADALFSSFERLFRRSGAGDSLAALSVGALIAPMNGSVASSSALLARLVAPRLDRMNAAGATALISVAATVGVVVPPSLVLILLGDAMLRAHTEASNLPGFALANLRIVNTQNVFHAALAPALAVLVLWALVAWWQGRKFSTAQRAARLKWTQWSASLLAVVTIVALLGAVFMGKMFAVEAAASGGVALCLVALATRALKWLQWREVLADTLSLSGALFALLVGATTFSLVFRLLGTDRWIAELVLGSSLSPALTAALVLLAVALCAWVLDAFEMIFVIIPIVAPALIVKLGDAQQASVLLLLVLQLSFLLPPMGYAVLMARARAGLGHVATLSLLRSLWPYLLVQALVTAAVFTAPWTVHQLDAPLSQGVDTTVPSNEELENQMRDMAQPPEPTEAQSNQTVQE